MADTGSATGRAQAAVVEPLTLRQIDPLQFGTLAVSQGEAGSVSVDPASGAVAYSGALGNACPSSTICGARPALFLVEGEQGRAYRVEAPGMVTAYHVANGFGLTVADLAVATENSTGAPMHAVLDGAGEGRFRVGGTLQVRAGSPAGFYRAELAMVVYYD